MKRKSFLFVLRRPPYEGAWPRESLDMILAAAAFDQTVRLLFLDEGVRRLQAGQRPESSGLEAVAPMFQVLPMYDVEEVWVEEESLRERGMSPASLILPARLLPRARVAEFLSGQDFLVAC